MNNYIVDSISYKNTKSIEKPNEDWVLFDDNTGVGVLLDGVSRDKENGIYPNPSPAIIATKLFADVYIQNMREEKTLTITSLKNAIYLANKKVLEYNKQLNHDFPAGTVGVVFCINEDVFRYAYIGDCYAGIIREKAFRIFTECQTDKIVLHKGKFSSNEIRKNICNNVSHPYGYGVWDGNPYALDFVKYGEIHLKKDDCILIFSDGMLNSINENELQLLKSKELKSLLKDKDSIGLDDRTCIRIIHT